MRGNQQQDSSPSNAFFLKDIYVHVAQHQRYDVAFMGVLLAFELLVGLAIIRNVPYTEIDWIAYIQEVEAYQQGELDYHKIRGDTGPLVYAAGFLYLFGWLKRWTDDGTSIRKAQYFFFAMYLAMQFLVLLLYQSQIASIRIQSRQQPQPQQAKTLVAAKIMSLQGDGVDLLRQSHRIWSWRIAMGILCLSKRIHSIFLLRLFNDGPTMLLLYLSIVLFARYQLWSLGCVVFSLAVSIKMNVLLFAPGLLLLLLQASPNLWTVVMLLGFGCAMPQREFSCDVKQTSLADLIYILNSILHSLKRVLASSFVTVILGAPFLLSHPVPYLRKAFELDRIFFYKWSVNWKVRLRRFLLLLEWSMLPSHPDPYPSYHSFWTRRHSFRSGYLSCCSFFIF